METDAKSYEDAHRMVDDLTGEVSRYNAELRRQELAWQMQRDSVEQSDRAAVDLGIHALKTVIFINAGAIAVILAFMSQQLGKNQSNALQILHTAPWFVWGLIMGGTGSAVAYFYQSAISRHRLRGLEELSVVDKTSLPKLRWLSPFIQITKILMIGTTFLSFILFLLGAISALNEFRQ
jgi:hypothetical protein